MEPAAVPPRVVPAKLLIPILVGAAVALGIGVYGNAHDPTGRSIFSLVFTKTINMKVWFASAAGVLALFQVFTAEAVAQSSRRARKRRPEWAAGENRRIRSL